MVKAYMLGWVEIVGPLVSGSARRLVKPAIKIVIVPIAFMLNI